MEIIDDFRQSESNTLNYKSLSTRSMLTIVFAVVTAMLLLVLITIKVKLINLYAYSSFPFFYSPDPRTDLIRTHAFFSKVTICAFILSCIFFFVWYYRAHKNLYDNKLNHTQYTPGQAVGLFFVP